MHMKKQTWQRFGKAFFLLGRRNDGEKVCLEDFSWDCDWYWGGGYLEVFNRTKTDIKEHYHLNGLDREKNLYDAVKGHFSKTVLSDQEMWRFCDLMVQFYALRKAAEVFQYGGHMTSHGRTAKELKQDMADQINLHIKNVIIPEVHKLFS